MPMKPISVNSALPAEHVGLGRRPRCAAARRSSQGWRPSSAVIQPAVFAMYGNGNASISTQSSGLHAEEPAAPPAPSSARPMTRDEQRPEPDHDVVRVVEQRDVVRPVASGNASRPLTSPSNVPIGEEAEHARDLRSGCRAGAVSTFGWPMSVIAAPSGSLSKRPSIAASVTGWWFGRPCLRLHVAGRERHQRGSRRARDDPERGRSAARAYSGARRRAGRRRPSPP